jgi:hypothetical protein
MNNTREIAIQTINRIFAEAAYMFVDKVNEIDGSLPDPDQFEGVSLMFNGEWAGEFHLWADSRFAAQAAANMLGIDENGNLAQSKGLDAMKELLNMIAGNFLTAAFGDEPKFEQGLPLSLNKESFKDDLTKNNVLLLEVEGNPVIFLVDYIGN